MIHREHALQRGVARFVRRTVSQPYVFVCWDRAGKQSAASHIYEAARGLISGWPDTGLFFDGRAFLCELKAPGSRPNENQIAVGGRLLDAGIVWFWADSVCEYSSVLSSYFAPGDSASWETMARYEDELVAADIRRQEAKAAGTVRRGKPMTAKPSAGRMRKINAVRARVLF